jgi:putative transposase
VLFQHIDRKCYLSVNVLTITRKVIYTTNAIESVNFSLRRLIKAPASFPNDEAAVKLLYLGLRNISQRWTMPIHNWKPAMSQFMIRFEKQLNPA